MKRKEDEKPGPSTGKAKDEENPGSSKPEFRWSKAKKTMIPINKVVPVLPDGDDDDDEFQDCMASPTKIALAQPKPRSPKEVIIIMFIMCSVVAIRDRAGEFCGPRKVNGNHSIGIHEAVAI